MKARTLALAPALMSALLLGTLAQLPAAAQQADAFTPGHTAWGDPDLQGVYTFSTQTPLERPEALGDKATYTEAEIAALEGEAADRRAADEVVAEPGDL
ncbi:MAG: hypothetical protein OXF98_01355, partial [Rhodospirillaceae bacterium]|nr:hypothetical protein [Rhodospirillaceae bacterium]